MFSEGIRLRHSSPRHLSWEATVYCIRLAIAGNVIVGGGHLFLRRGRVLKRFVGLV